MRHILATDGGVPVVRRSAVRPIRRGGPMARSPRAAYIGEEQTSEGEAMRRAVVVCVVVVLACSAAPAGGQSLLRATDLTYLGAFTAPAGDDWSYGGHALAYLPSGDPSGPADGFPGSLYLAGNAQYDLVGEITIPAPVIADDVLVLPAASELRAAVDITGGMLQGVVCASCVTCEKDIHGLCTNFDVGGLEYLAGVDRVAWTVFDWYNAGDEGEDLVSLGWSTRDMSSAAGAWHIGPRPNTVEPRLFHNAKTSDYLFSAPAGFAAAHLGGRSLVSGYHRLAGALGGSQGPTMYASAPWLDGSPPAHDTDLGATPLLYYRTSYDCASDTGFDPLACDFEGYRADDRWAGGVWLETSQLHGILIFGLKGLGDTCYGTPGDPAYPDCDVVPACSPYQGYHSDPYEPWILFYDPDQIAEVAAGTRDPWNVQPYAHHFPQSEVFDPACGILGAAALDRDRDLIYVVEQTGDPDGTTVIHVWQVTGALFADGFESGGTDAWSPVAP